MHSSSSRTFAATPQGITLNGKPLTKSGIDALPPHSLRYLIRASELMAGNETGRLGRLHSPQYA